MQPHPNSSLNTAEETMVFSSGQTIFLKGDPGGDIYIIQQGEIEVYSLENGVEIPLSSMNVGEVLGVMTCLTNEPRMASAKAKTEVVLKRIRHIHIKRLVGNLPTWMKIVLKDFTVRLNQMNKLYSESVGQLLQLKKNQISYVFLCSRICSLLSTSQKYLSVPLGDSKVIYYDTALTFVTNALFLPEQLTTMLLEAMIDTNMIQIAINRDNNKKYITSENAEKLVLFCHFLNEAKRGPYKKILETNFSTKDLKVLSGLIQIAKRMGMEISKSCQIQIKDFSLSLEKMTGTKFELESIQKAEKLGMLQVISDEKIQFLPTDLSRILVNVHIYKKLDKLEETHRQKKLKKESAA